MGAGALLGAYANLRAELELAAQFAKPGMGAGRSKKTSMGSNGSSPNASSHSGGLSNSAHSFKSGAGAQSSQVWDIMDEITAGSSEEKEHLAMLRKAFDAIDIDGGGSLDMVRVEVRARTLSLKGAWFSKL